jgi:hypothetical protein
LARQGAEQAKTERLRRLRDHGAVFGRMILDGAFERIYEPDGSYRLRPVGHTGSPEHPMPGEGESVQADAPPAAPPKPSVTDDAVVRSSGYCAALRDVSCWVAAVAMEPRMDAGTLAALNTEIERLSPHGNAEHGLGEPHQMRRALAAGRHGA